jgi:hypothetical protein
VACHRYHGGTYRRFTHMAQYQTVAMIHSSCTSIWSNLWYHWSICFFVCFESKLYSLWKHFLWKLIFLPSNVVLPQNIYVAIRITLFMRWKLNSFQLEQFFQWEQFKWKHL